VTPGQGRQRGEKRVTYHDSNLGAVYSGKKSPMGGATISFWHVLVWGIVRPWLSCVGNTCRARSAATVLPLAHPLLMHPYVMYVRDIQRLGDAEAMLGARSACAEWGCGCQPPAVPKPRKIPTPAFTGPQRTRPSAPLQLPCGLNNNIPIPSLYVDQIGGQGVAS
jgi:hypothetical protein